MWHLYQKCKGPPYNSDFVIFRQLQSEEQPSEATGLVVYQKSYPIILIKVKAGIPIISK